MIIAVLGGTGGTGKPFVRHALEQGHKIRLVARTPSKVEEQVKNSPNVTIIQGSFADAAVVDEAVKGSDAVISMAGDPKATHLMPIVAKTVVESMRKHGSKKFLYQAGSLSHGLDEKTPILITMLNWTVVPLMGLSELVAGNNAVINFLRDIKDIDWVITRPGELMEAESKGKAKRSAKYLGTKLAYVDAAHATYDCLMDPEAVYTCDYIEY